MYEVDQLQCLTVDYQVFDEAHFVEIHFLSALFRYSHSRLKRGSMVKLVSL